jgi:hypothetical protein
LQEARTGLPSKASSGSDGSLDAIGMSRAALGRCRRTTELQSRQLEGPRLRTGSASSLRPLPDHIVNNTVVLALFGG